ncbi:MAG: hypothetical protein HY518_01995 [Candidatus Aenigmarchaeota archaeon]|nr:hypothetical protein [Candidatus Aenigmarchaeota archaeon]
MEKIITGILAAVLIAAIASPALASRPGFVFPGGCCFYDGDTVRTVVPPAAFPNQGTDNFYAIAGGAAGQKGVVAVAPGDIGYNGGHWAFHSVTWNTAPYLLTSEAAVLAAEAAGDVTITRIPANDFLCPIQK